MMKAVGMKPISNVLQSRPQSRQSSFWASWKILVFKKGLKQVHMEPHGASLGPKLHNEGFMQWNASDAVIMAWRCETDSPQEPPTSCICPRSWSGWRKPGWRGRSTSCPTTLTSSPSSASTPLPFSTSPHISPSSPLPCLMYCFATTRHATTESKLWPEEEEGGRGSSNLS